jgi:hypothetical protein
LVIFLKLPAFQRLEALVWIKKRLEALVWIKKRLEALESEILIL